MRDAFPDVTPSSALATFSALSAAIVSAASARDATLLARLLVHVEIANGADPVSAIALAGVARPAPSLERTALVCWALGCCDAGVC